MPYIAVIASWFACYLMKSQLAQMFTTSCNFFPDLFVDDEYSNFSIFVSHNFSVKFPLPTTNKCMGVKSCKMCGPSISFIMVCKLLVSGIKCNIPFFNFVFGFLIVINIDGWAYMKKLLVFTYRGVWNSIWKFWEKWNFFSEGLMMEFFFIAIFTLTSSYYLKFVW